MKIQTLLPILLVAFLSAGCSSMIYSQVRGSLPPTPLGGGVNVDSSYAVPVFRELPDRAYTPAGVIKFDSPGVTWNEGDVAQAAKLAKTSGGNAMILCQGAGIAVQVLGKPMVNELNLGAYHTFGIVIQWKPESAPAK